MKVVLVHGIFDNGRNFKKMRRYLDAQGHDIYVPALKKADGRQGIKALAEQLKTYIDAHISEGDTFVLIGFSMGCIISRYFLQVLERRQHCVAFHAISGPHNGSAWARILIGPGFKDLRPGSAVLEKLKRSEDALKDIALYSYRTPLDLMILPSSSSYWPCATNYISYSMLHRFMLSNTFVLETIRKSLNKVSIEENN